MLESVGNFVVHVFAFWGLWKILDKILHHLTRSKSTTVLVSGKENCLDKVDKSNESNNRKRISPDVHEELRILRTENEKLKTKILEDIAIELLNTVSLEDLTEIYGVGQVTADRLIKNRPFSCIRDADDIIPGSNYVAIMSWARRIATL